MTIQMLFLCDHIRCHAREDVFAPQYGWPLHPDDVEMPDGWGLDQNGSDYVLHCPEHRTELRLRTRLP